MGSSTINHQLMERDIHENQLAENIGRNWKDLARALGFREAVIEAIEMEKGGNVKECCIAVIVRWIRREGRNATVENFADALINIKLKSLADILMCNDTTQVRLRQTSVENKQKTFVRTSNFRNEAERC